jgi:20S proteasome subunit beta 4
LVGRRRGCFVGVCVCVATMDSLLGFIGKDYAMLAADANAARSILVFKQDEDKILPLSKKMIMAASGNAGDRVQFSEYIQKNVVLNELRAGFPMSCVATANFVRNEISGNLRRRPYNVNCLLGGFEKGKGSCLYYVDYFGTMHKQNFGCHGA